MDALTERRLRETDRQWLVELAGDEDVSVSAVVRLAVRHFRGWQEKGRQSLRQVVMLVDRVCSRYEEALRSQHAVHEHMVRTAGAPSNAPWDDKVAKLLALAVSSDSLSEACEAFVKARMLHRRLRLRQPQMVRDRA